MPNKLFHGKSNNINENLRDVNDPVPAAEKAENLKAKLKKRWDLSKKARSSFRIRPRYVFAALASICIALIILSVNVPEIRAPFKAAASFLIEPAQNGVNKLGLWISDRLTLLKSIEELQAENESMQNEIERLSSSNESLKQNENELIRLRELVELKEFYSEYDMVAARIVAKDTSGWFSAFTVNKGSLDGIKTDMNVIADGALIGIVTDVGLNYSTVRSIIDDESNVSAEFQNSGEICTVSGNLTLMENNLIEFSQVDVSADIEVGETVLTSHVSSKYLPGLIIGYIASFELDSNELTKSGYITPAADFTRLKEVLIITTLKSTWDDKNAIVETESQNETEAVTETALAED